MNYTRPTLILYMAVTALLFPSPASGGGEQWTFRKIVEAGGPVPDGGGATFPQFSTVGEFGGGIGPAISKGNVAFHFSLFGQGRGIYKQLLGGPLTKVADSNTPIPKGTGTFTPFDRGFLRPDIDEHGNVTFFVDSFDFLNGFPRQVGIYAETDGGTLGVVADNTTLIPDDTVNFAHIGGFPTIDNGNVAFLR